MKRAAAVFLTAFLLAAVSCAEAFDIKGLQPLAPFGVFSTFSAESLPAKAGGLGLELERSEDPDFYRSTFKGAYGLSDAVELNFNLPYVFDAEEVNNGLEDLSLGVKHRILNETTYSPAIAYLVSFAIPTGDDQLSTEGRIGGGLLVTKKVGPFKGHMNLLYFHPMKDGLKDDYNVNLGAELALGHSSTFLAEAVGKKDFFKNKLTLLEWRIGYRFVTADNVYASVGAGFDFKSRTPDYRLLFSLSMVFPSKQGSSNLGSE